MQTIFRAAIVAFAAILGFGLFAVAQAGAAGADQVAATRQDDASVLSDSDDDDDDDLDTDLDDNDPDTFDSNTGVSNDATGSRVTKVSRDRDISNDDLTKDRTMDGGDPTLDLTQNHTNDSTKNDTRG